MSLKQIDENSLERFLGYMRTKMEQNVHKPVHWSELDVPILMLKLKEEMAELEGKIAVGSTGLEVISECADIANFAMFIGFCYTWKKSNERNEDKSS
jgi:hypothetical protein